MLPSEFNIIGPSDSSDAAVEDKGDDLTGPGAGSSSGGMSSSCLSSFVSINPESQGSRKLPASHLVGIGPQGEAVGCGQRTEAGDAESALVYTEMPLVTLCGHPCAGKTHYAEQLQRFLLDRGAKSVRVVNEESEAISRTAGYANSAAEKTTRGLLKSAVDHALSTECFVICDSLNYIKGFRYELHCLARTLRTPHCTVWVQCDDAIRKARQEERQVVDAYPDQVFEDLRLRFEAPNEKNRWDSPLFLVSSAQLASSESSTEPEPDPNAAAAEVESVFSTEGTSSSWRRKAIASPASSSFRAAPRDRENNRESTTARYCTSSAAASTPSAAGPPEASCAAIYSHLCSVPSAQPNSSTLSAPRGAANTLYELDNASQQVVNLIVNAQKDASGSTGNPVVMLDFDRSITLHRHVGVAELQRHRRQFVVLNTKHPPPADADKRALGALFIDFLALQI